MLEVASVLDRVQGRTEVVCGDFIPRLRDVRRVPVRYQHILPLSIIKRHQCIVLGASARTLTVGIIERKDRKLLNLLQALTGSTIFPVLVEPQRMRLLIARMERDLRFQKRYSRAYHVQLLPAQVRLQLLFRERIARERG